MAETEPTTNGGSAGGGIGAILAAGDRDFLVRNSGEQVKPSPVLLSLAFLPPSRSVVVARIANWCCPWPDCGPVARRFFVFLLVIRSVGWNMVDDPMWMGFSWSVGEGFCFANFTVELGIFYFYWGRRTVELGRHRGEQDCQFLTG